MASMASMVIAFLVALAGYRDYLGVGRRRFRGLTEQPEVAAAIEKMMKDRGLPIERF